MKEFIAVALNDIQSLTWDEKPTGRIRVKKNKTYKFTKTFDELWNCECYEYIDEDGRVSKTDLDHSYFINNFRILND